LIKEFCSLNYKVYALSPADAYTKYLEKYGVEHIDIKISRSGLNPLQDILLLFKLIEIFRRYKPDIIQLFTIKPNIYGTIAGRIAGVKNIYNMITGLGYIFIGDSIKKHALRKFTEILYRNSLLFSKHVYFQNNDDRNYFITHNMVNREKTSIVAGSGVNTEYFSPRKKIKRNVNDRIVFILVSRMIRDKGITEFVDAAYQIKKHFDNVNFLLLGPIDTTYPNSISRTTLEQWNKEGIVKYLGATDDVRPYLARADVIVLPSYREGTPVSILEGLAMGMPVITSDAIGCRETVRHGRNGFLVQVKDSQALASAMISFIQKPDLIDQMGRESRKLAVETFDVKIVNQKILKKYPLYVK
jgi:glycosyltransferase involved in cell wall biosynthesis